MMTRIRIAEVDYDPSANYELGHIPGAVLIDWKSDINDPIRRTLLTISSTVLNYALCFHRVKLKIGYLL
jgi:3-mercaptopyruvate sulfurtransferase SseA